MLSSLASSILIFCENISKIGAHDMINVNWKAPERRQCQVVKGERMMYTCCLAYADEDEGMAQIITDLYTKASPGSLFFRPQWDLKHGKYVYDTTARVIEERCGGKIMFLISEYFLASDVCRFAVNFARNLNPEGDKGRLIPLLLTENYSHIPTVLRGIAGIKWHNTWSRQTAWANLSGALLKDGSSSEMDKVKNRIKEEVDSNTDRYLGDPPYEDSIGPPKAPIFSPDSDVCRAPSIENVDEEEIQVKESRLDKAAGWFTRKFRGVARRLRRRNENSQSGPNSIELGSASSIASSPSLYGSVYTSHS